MPEEKPMTAIEHIEQLVELLKLIKEHWIEYDHVYAISVYEAERFISETLTLSSDTSIVSFDERALIGLVMKLTGGSANPAVVKGQIENARQRVGADQ